MYTICDALSPGGLVQVLGEVVTSQTQTKDGTRNSVGYVRRAAAGGLVLVLGEVVTSQNSNEGRHEEQRGLCATHTLSLETIKKKSTHQ